MLPLIWNAKKAHPFIESTVSFFARGANSWDLDACRDEFIRKELFGAPLINSRLDPSSKRAALLSAYLALLRNKAIPASGRLQLSVVMALPSYHDYASHHSVLGNLTNIKVDLGEHSQAFLQLNQTRQGLNAEYDSFASTSKTFAHRVSREDYLSCGIAVLSRAFKIPHASSEVGIEERKYYQRTLGIDFSSDVVSIQSVNDWMNSHVNNNVQVGGFDIEKRSVHAWSTKAIAEGQELINSYGDHVDYVRFSQYGYIPPDGTGSSIAWLSAHHTRPLPSLDELIPYLQMDYGYVECIRKESQPDAFELKRLKLLYLQRITTNQEWWVLPLPPRSSTGNTPTSTTDISNDFKVPSFGPIVSEYLDTNALRVSLPCRLITLTGGDLKDASSLLIQDLTTLEISTTLMRTPELRLEGLDVSIEWMTRTIHCMRTLASTELQKYELSVADQESRVYALAKKGSWNTLEWFLAHMKLEEMQSLEAMANWAQGALDSVTTIQGVSLDEVVRSEPCPKTYSLELIESAKTHWR